MKPIKLRMQNFGPYVDETVDFGDFFDAPVFLISGKTGTGKTTIFDAMCFALFGRTSGGERDAEEMRSDFASDQELTEVSFIFEDHKKSYQITRSPKQTVASRRGNGQTVRAAKVSLIYQDPTGEKREIDKINQANQFINNLLNLTAEQFSQIVLLPQGQFRNFLAADSNDKETVLRELFGTEFYQRFVENIKDRTKERRNAAKQQLAYLHDLQKGANFDEPEKVDPEQPVLDWLDLLAAQLKLQNEQLNKYKAENDVNEQKKTQLDRLYQAQQSLLADQQKLVQYQQEAKKLQEKEAEITKLKKHVQDLEWADQQQGTLKDLTDSAAQQIKLKAEQENGKQRQGELKSALAEIEQKQSMIKANEPQILAFQGKVERLKDKVNLYQEVERLHQQQRRIATQVKLAQEKVANAQKELTESKQKQQELTKKLETYADLHQQALQLQEQKQRVHNFEQHLQELQQSIYKKEQTKQQIADLKKELTELRLAAKAAQDKYNEMDSQYAADQIVLLAARLKPGTPCPLCGSTEHPHPAANVAVAKPVTKQQVQTAQKEAQQAAAAVNTKWGTLEARSNYVDQQSKEIQTQQEKLADNLSLAADSSLDKVVQAIEEKRKQLEQDGQKQEKRQAENDAMTTQLASLQVEQPQIETKGKAAAEKYTQLQITKEKLQTECEQKQAQLPPEYASSRELKSQLDSWQEKISAHQHEKEQVQQQLSSLNEQLAGVESGFRERAKQQAEAIEKHENARQKLVQACLAYNEQMDLRKLTALNSELSTLSQLRDQIQGYQQEVTINQTTQKQLKQRIAGQPQPQIAETKKEIQQLQVKQDELFQKRSLVNHRFNQNKETYQHVSEIWQQYQNELEQDQQWNQLADVVSGKGKLKLNIERYVLQSYFKQVLEVANQRFAELTGGRYSFCLDKKTGSYASNTGLELDIYDDNAGKIRSVHTLSGGESFIAALCLALALGEVVSAQAGGVSVEALFVDEGFGSLDTDSLQVALDALRAIEGENRLIGIISHVTELRTEIPDQLHVLSDNGRSVIKYEHEFEQ